MLHTRAIIRREKAATMKGGRSTPVSSRQILYIVKPVSIPAKRKPSSFKVILGYLSTGLSALARSLPLGPQHRTKLATNQLRIALTHWIVEAGDNTISKHANVVLTSGGARAISRGLKKEFWIGSGVTDPPIFKCLSTQSS
jgi:hypothetical protein